MCLPRNSLLISENSSKSRKDWSVCILEPFASCRWDSVKRSWESLGGQGELGFFIVGWEELQRPEESEHWKGAWEAEIGEIEEIMPPVSFDVLVSAWMWKEQLKVNVSPGCPVGLSGLGTVQTWPARTGGGWNAAVHYWLWTSSAYEEKSFCNLPLQNDF